ncbi:MAG: glycosyltransferase family 4 protein [Methylococcales bacterium]|jgi:UDP-glucose:(heptosyl)LPS alpha-1,3-glucosyltransferase|nr:glycosyltransferase family 4 protein [Methylococcales bacterium]MBT7411068.1 glycosyltransferase family 4 protein [Methylococcales bacterium]
MSKSHNICLIRQKYRDDGGAERFVSRALEALSHQDLNVAIIARQWQTQKDVQGIKCNPFYLGRTWRDFAFAKCVCQTLKEHSFDLVQSHERIACCDLYRAGDGVHREWLKQRSQNISIISRLVQQFSLYHRYIMSAEKKLFESDQLKAVICNAEMVKQEILGYFSINPDKIHVIYSGVDTQAFNPSLKSHRKVVRQQLNIAEDACVYLFVGSGFVRKGVEALLKAFKSQAETSHLVIVGKDKKQQQFVKMSEALNVQNRVHFMGAQSDVKPYYGMADVFVLPTIYDPFPNVCLEAMAAGLPIITSTKCGAAEFVKSGENGYVCDALDDDALAVHMRSLVELDVAKQAGLNAREVIEPYNLEKMSENLVALYQSLGMK